MVRLLSEADRALGELSGLGRTMPNPHLLIGPFIRREAVLSSRIEGTQTDLADLYAYEAGQLPLFPEVKPPPPEADLREVGNYVKAMEYGLERVKTLPVSLRLIRELHERLMAGVRGAHATPGEFRHSQNWIGPPGCTLNEAEFVPPPVPEMQEGLSTFEKYLHRDDPFPPLIRLAFIHYQFEALHPFVDGNGRIGRLLVSLLMVNWNLLPLPLLYLSAFFEANRQAYYDLLFGVSARGAWLEWLRFFLQGVAEQARDAGTRAKKLQDLQGEWHRRLARTRSTGLLFRLVDNLFVAPVMSISQAQSFLGVTYRSAKLNVEKLAQAGILRQMGESTYGKTYLAEDILLAIT
jgi:Fic family protein